MVGILLLISYIILGVAAGAALFTSEQTWFKKLWLGGVVGMMLLMWTHVPFSFLFGFTVLSHVLGFLLSLIIVCAIVFLKPLWLMKQGHKNGEIIADYRQALAHPFRNYFTKFTKKDAFMLGFTLTFLAVAVVLVVTHTLNYDDGAYYTGQATYGDMNMHLGFITSIARQHTFPPTYSLLGGVEPLNYPFMCDSVSSSMLLFGSSLRVAYMTPMFFAFWFVFMGVWYVAEAILKSIGRTSLAFSFFCLDGGFGLIYFLDGTASNKTNFTRIFTAFYETPTNLVDKNVRWTNVIADMLLPQRATLFGWMCLFIVLYILYRAVFEKKKSYFLVSGVLAGLLPMIHTHSYLAAGIIAFAWIIVSCIRDKFRPRILLCWLMFGVPALILSVPQLVMWTFNAVGGEHFVRFIFNWSNSSASPKDSWTWFWVKNVGLTFLLIPAAFLSAEGKKKLLYIGPFLIFTVAELIVFQPNLYDNIKLFFVWYLYMAIMIADFLGRCYQKLKGVRGIKYIAVLIVIVMTISGTLTIGRELVSARRDKETNKGEAYQLYNSANVKAAEWIEQNTDPKSVFLCWNNHNNTISSLTGRNIYVGAGTFLYFHGVNYRDREALMKSMLTDETVFEANRVAANIDYVYIGDYERGNLSNLITPYLRENYERVYNDSGIEIFKVSDR